MDSTQRKSLNYVEERDTLPVKHKLKVYIAPEQKTFYRNVNINGKIIRFGDITFDQRN